MLSSGNCLRFDTRAHLLAFLWPQEGQILPHKDSEEVRFQGKSIQNLVKTSPRLSRRLTFEPFTHEIVGIVWDLMPGLICRPFYGPYKVKYCPMNTQKKSIFKENWQEIWLKRPLLDSSVDLLLRLLHMQWWELVGIWYRGSFRGVDVAGTQNTFNFERNQ